MWEIVPPDIQMADTVMRNCISPNGSSTLKSAATFSTATKCRRRLQRHSGQELRTAGLDSALPRFGCLVCRARLKKYRPML